jgi:hypothetical protein
MYENSEVEFGIFIDGVRIFCMIICGILDFKEDRIGEDF